MPRVRRMKYGFPIALIIWFYLDGILGATLQHQMFNYPYAMSSYLAVLWLIFAVLFEGPNNNHLELWSVLIGILFDIYYTGVLGVFVFVLPIIVLLTKLCYRDFPINFLTGMLIAFIDITVITAASFAASQFTHITTATLADMLVYSLGPTLAYNLAAFVILYYPVQRLFDWMKG